MTSPWYRVIGNEQELFERAAALCLPILLKGPTGCGKSRFVRYMAKQLNRRLITVSCQEDLSAADLTGRYLLQAGETVWQDGPVTQAVRTGAVLYLDEFVEARPDVLTLLHPLTDDRRLLTIERLGEELEAADGFQVVVSYNPGYQRSVRAVKESTRQRFVSLSFGYPSAEIEAEIVAHESGCTAHVAAILVEIGRATRALRNHGLKEGASTRLIIYAAQLVQSGVSVEDACCVTMANSLTDDPDLISAIEDLVKLRQA